MDNSGSIHLLVPDYPATGATVTVPLRGMVVAVGVVYNFFDVYSTTMDLSITEVNTNQPDQTILEISAGDTDGWFYPVKNICDDQGAAITDQYSIGVPVYGDVEITISNAAPGDSMDITFKLV